MVKGLLRRHRRGRAAEVLPDYTGGVMRRSTARLIPLVVCLFSVLHLPATAEGNDAGEASVTTALMPPENSTSAVARFDPIISIISPTAASNTGQL